MYSWNVPPQQYLQLNFLVQTFVDSSPLSPPYLAKYKKGGELFFMTKEWNALTKIFFLHLLTISLELHVQDGGLWIFNIVF